MLALFVHTHTHLLCMTMNRDGETKCPWRSILFVACKKTEEVTSTQCINKQGTIDRARQKARERERSRGGRHRMNDQRRLGKKYVNL